MFIANLHRKVDFLRTCKPIQLNKKTPSKENLHYLKQQDALNRLWMCPAPEIVNSATKYLRDLTKHLRQILDGHILIVLQVTPANSFQPLAKLTKNFISDVSGILDFLSVLM